MVLAYRGTTYAGWQVQPDAPSVQGEVEKALARLLNHPVRLAASGRTDAGVHAWGQVAAFSTENPMRLAEIRRALSAMLPPDILCRALSPVAPEFHPRYGAKRKTYCYYLAPGRAPNPFTLDMLWPIKHNLSPGPVREALAGLPGERDLAGLASGPVEVKGGTERLIESAVLVVEPGGLWRVEITANGFLRHVVRNLVGVLYQIGAGKLAPKALMEIIRAGHRLYAGPKAPPGGLYLARVEYENAPPAGEGEN